jgi:diacylglycerol O-acyltransferase / wax synthase
MAAAPTIDRRPGPEAQMPLLNALDAAWLYVESREAPMHVAGLQIFSLPPGAPDDYVGQMLAGFKSSHTISAPWNQRLSGGWLDRVLPSWATDDAVDLDYHVRHSGLPRPAGERELGILVSRLHSQALDLTRPLWECHFIEGLEGGRFAIYTKMHHSMIDGVSGMRMLQRMLSTSPETRGMRAPWAVAPSCPSDASRASQDEVGTPGWLAGTLVTAVDILRTQAGSLGDVVPALFELVCAGVGLDDSLTAPLACPASLLNGRVTAQRRFATQDVTLADVKAVAAAADGTMNDIVLAICSGAVRRFLLELGALPGDPLTAGLPVNVRLAGDERPGTGISFICANLATNVEDPRKRIEAIRASTARAKAHLRHLPDAALTQYTIAFMAPYILQLLTGLGGHLRPAFNVTISNVQGPDHLLYLNGARLDSMYPLSLLSHGQALNITCLSYAGRLHFGITGCRDTLPHMQRLAVYAGEAFEELKALYLRRRPSRSARAAKKSISAPRRARDARDDKKHERRAAGRSRFRG